MTKEQYANAHFMINHRGIFYEGEYIMNAWEEQAIKCKAQEIVDTYKPESILELGYGLGYTASIFKQVKRHLIIEPNKELAQIARDNGYDVWEGYVQDFKTDEHFDIVYNDIYDMVHGEGKDYLKNIPHTHYLEFELCTHTYHFPQNT